MTAAPTAESCTAESCTVEHNIAGLFLKQARSNPQREAVVECKGGPRRALSFGELETRTARIAGGLHREGVRSGDRVALFVPPGIDFLSITWALFRLGAVPVLADPGMGRKRLLSALKRTGPRVIIGVGKALLARRLFPGSFSSIQMAFAVGPCLPGLGKSLPRVERNGPEWKGLEPVKAKDTAAILFTSGSTGPPKGVPITHHQLAAEVRGLKATLGFSPGERDLCGLPAFALFDCALGITSVFPPIDPARPASVDPAALLAVIHQERTTTGFLSPALWRLLVPHCIDQRASLSPMIRAVSAGAPLAIDVVRDLKPLLAKGGDVFTPYGSTEALPVTVISGAELLPLEDRIASGEGTPVGRAAPGMEICLLDAEGERLSEMDPARALPTGSVGEVFVRGAVVTQSYDQAPEAQAAAKLPDPRGKPDWHRMGDMGCFDHEGILWFLGRNSHCLKTSSGLRPPVGAENVFLSHPSVARCALVGLEASDDAELPVLIVEPVSGKIPATQADKDLFVEELRALAQTAAASRDIETFLFHPSLPVDPRHNSKIHRGELKLWAARQASGSALR